MGKSGLTHKQQRKIYFASGSTHPELAEATATHMGLELGPIERKTHPNTESYVRYEKSIRGMHAIVFQTHAAVEGRSVNDSLQEQILMIDAAKRASARTITAVMPMLGYSRQDRKAKGREPISSAAVIRQLENAGANRLVSVDMHSAQMQGVFNGPFDHLTAEKLIRKAMKKTVKCGDPDEFIVVSPDAGRAKSSEHFAKRLGVDMVVMPKTRDRKDSSKIVRPKSIDEVDGRICFLNDDMIDTAGTLVSAAETLQNSGASRIISFATHGIFSKPALERINNSPIDCVIVTDTMPVGDAQEVLGDRLQVLPIAPIIGQALTAIVAGGSVSSIFRDRNYS